MEGTTQPGLTPTLWSALGDEVPVMLDGHDGRAVREQAVEDSEQGLHVEPKQTVRIAENSGPFFTALPKSGATGTKTPPVAAEAGGRPRPGQAALPCASGGAASIPGALRQRLPDQASR
jgi:hypothetical protein